MALLTLLVVARRTRATLLPSHRHRSIYTPGSSRHRHRAPSATSKTGRSYFVGHIIRHRRDREELEVKPQVRIAFGGYRERLTRLQDVPYAYVCAIAAAEEEEMVHLAKEWYIVE